ncbi:glycosyltransferase [Algiphilus sp. NNCM1]|uniref:glycosyltransferase family 2 protein n=1 Tax=Algiphilus sp. TaxID=1872431 RepID=UPI001CA6C2D9|nr:glycosyltransferase [Algiphilus sp.]MBY8964313.1 glycosyltransferase [Algiphilus acroporae]MCI5104342.1 glycosyltransferase [Algiphilus sp.]
MRGISVIIPCYNAERHLADAIDSVRVQDGVDYELIVVDDGSHDASRDIAASFRDVRLIHSHHQGAAAARNLGLARAKGVAIRFLDADDTLCDGVLARQWAQLKALEPHECPYGDYLLQRPQGASLRRLPTLSDKAHAAQVALTDLMTSTPLHRRDWLESIGGFDPRFDSSQEWNLHVRLANAGVRFRHFDLPVYRYRAHDDPKRLSRAKQRSMRYIDGELQKIRWTAEAVALDDALFAALARRAVWLARVATKRCEAAAAHRCFAVARALSPHYTRYWPKRYRLIHRALGPERAEHALMAYWRRR